jgi:hypothetical protein
MVERPALPSKTGETIDADFTGLFDPLTRGKIGELFGTTTMTGELLFSLNSVSKPRMLIFPHVDRIQRMGRLFIRKSITYGSIALE